MSPPAVQAPPRTIEAVERLRAVFTEIPGTVVSLGEASRLSEFEPDRCEPILDAFMNTGFLVRGGDGRFRRQTEV